MTLRLAVVALALSLVACSSSSSSGGAGGGSAATGGGTAAAGGGSAAAGGGTSSAGGGTSSAGGGSVAAGGGTSSAGGGTTAAGGGTTAAGGGTTAAGGGTTSTGDIGTWTDAPGACPTGMTKIDITTEGDLEDATRGEGSHAGDAASVCYFIHNGTYQQNGTTLSMYIKTGGTDATHRRVFIGQTRAGVIVKGRVTIDAGVNHVQLSNLTYDITGYVQSGSFNTLSTLENSTDLRIDHVTFTGDCLTGANGGHIEVSGSTDVIVDSCLIEKFGRCGPNGHQDHGVYLANGSNITITNNEIRGNSSRGIQLNTEGGAYGTLDHVTLTRNRIHDNGHEDYEDGIVMNATGTGNISSVTIQHNLIYGNYYSGFRESGDVFASIVVSDNTFFHNGAGSTAAGRSDVNLDDVGSGAATSVTKNIIVSSTKVMNDCYDSMPRSYAITDNVIQGTVPSGTAANCVSGSVTADPMFTNSGAADFHNANPASAAYGAYAP